MTPLHAAALRLALLAAAAPAALAQWNPPQGDWLKSEPTDLRFMTWNIEDGICRTADKSDAFNSWNALVRTVAALQPDVLILQEAGDNSGNGTGTGVDSEAQLTTTLELFIHGGTDPFLGGTVGSYTQKFVPGYDLPHIYVSPSSDGFNRNVILSRFPFADLNGDGTSRQADFFMLADPTAWNLTGNGGIRGFQHAEIDLPDDVYLGDLVVGNSHLKSGSSGSDLTDRLNASKNISYYIQYYYNTNQTGNDDPNNVIINPADGTTPLDANTPVIWGGDWNQVPSAGGPSTWMPNAQTTGGFSDGTDRDGSDATRDGAFHPISFETSTRGGSKLDYIAWQDSIASARRQVIFNSSASGMNLAALPFPTDTYPVNPLLVSSLAADHRAVFVDFILPLAPSCPCDVDGNGMLTLDDLDAFITAFSSGSLEQADCDASGVLNLDDLDCFIACFAAGCP